MSLTALKTLAASSKATVLVGVVAVLGVLVYLGKLDAQQMLTAVEYLVPSWFLAHAGEQGARHLAGGKVAPAPAPAEVEVEVDADATKPEPSK